MTSTIDDAIAEIPNGWYLYHLGEDGNGCSHLPPWAATLREPNAFLIIRGWGADPYLAILTAIGNIPDAEPEAPIRVYSGSIGAGLGCDSVPSPLADRRASLIANRPASPSLSRRSLT